MGALDGAPGLDGLSSSWDQFQWHIELTQKRSHEARELLNQSAARDPSGCFSKQLDATYFELSTSLTTGRELAHNMAPLGAEVSQARSGGPGRQISMEPFDAVFASYSQACKVIIDQVARCVEDARPGSSEGRRAARRYR